MDWMYVMFIVITSALCALITNYSWYGAINKNKFAEALIVNIYLLALTIFVEVAMYPGYMVRGQEPGPLKVIGLAILFSILNVTLSLVYVIFSGLRKTITDCLTNNYQKS